MAKRKGRAIDGILLLDKPSGITSNAALQTVKRLYFAAKAGHTGSLDPLASGVLPICLGEATKFSQYLLDADKAYRTTIRLGITTDSGDADGTEIARSSAAHLTEQDVAVALEPFRGVIQQVPSMFSAIKRDGQPLYKLARAGIEVEREARTVEIKELVLEAFRAGDVAEVDVRILCSKGTYVRSIAEDLGAALGVGGHVAVLRRIGAGPFTEAECVPLSRLETLRQQSAFAELDALLRPTELAVADLPRVTLGESTGFYLRQGQAVLVPQAPTSGLVQLHLASGGFIGIGEILDDGRVAPRRLVNQPQAATVAE
ncbi:MAG: tRNA pseudouridine(55) synthase TruB [Spongiibacteraceae bacterium]|jgi:tRNA pseudouridine55 synthase|nr:tRNA pseudouridine(55) synthase TruB [Spongiibacteraceae bacterium]